MANLVVQYGGEGLVDCLGEALSAWDGAARERPHQVVAGPHGKGSIEWSLSPFAQFINFRSNTLVAFAEPTSFLMLELTYFLDTLSLRQ